MSIYTRAIIEYIIVFIGIFLFNYFYFVRKQKKLKKDNMPLELTYLTGLYGIDPKRINFRHFQYTYCLTNAFIISTTYIIITYLVKYMLLKVIIGIVLIILLIIVCYGILGRYYIYKEDEEVVQKKKK